MKKIAILVPCYNEEKTIYAVVSEFKRVLPNADVYVYDNCSTDKTSEEAKNAGAIVKYEPKKGKGNVVKSMFRDIDADIYIMIDGDMTYDINDAPRMVSKLEEKGLDMVAKKEIQPEIFMGKLEKYIRGKFDRMVVKY